VRAFGGLPPFDRFGDFHRFSQAFGIHDIFADSQRQ
jgi:hypothetical protein